jgi:uncharacterized protein
LTLGSGLNRAQPSPTDPPTYLAWSSDPVDADLDIVGDIELRLDAISTAADTAWIVTLQDIDPDGTTTNITAGFLRASLRQIDETQSHPGAPVLPCREAEAIPIGEVVRYRVPLIPNARRLTAGHRLRLVLNSDDQPAETPAIMGFRHATVGTSSLNSVLSSSQLVLPTIAVGV